MIRTDRTAIFYASVISLGGFLFGFDAAVISGVVGFVTNEFNLNEWLVEHPTAYARKDGE